MAVNIGEIWNLGKEGTHIGEATQFQTVGALVSIILKNVYILSGIIFFILIIGGGYSIISGAGQNDPKKTLAGQKAITSALIGFLLIFASYWIIQLIAYITGIEDLLKIF